MFKKLKDKIAEEVKQSPARFQEIINSAQVGTLKMDGIEMRKDKLIRVSINYIIFSKTCIIVTCTLYTLDKRNVYVYRQLLARLVQAALMKIPLKAKIHRQQMKIFFRSRKKTHLKTAR